MENYFNEMLKSFFVVLLKDQFTRSHLVAVNGNSDVIGRGESIDSGKENRLIK